MEIIHITNNVLIFLFKPVITKLSFAVYGLKENHITFAPKDFNIKHNHEPLKPDAPVTRTVLSRNEFK